MKTLKTVQANSRHSCSESYPNAVAVVKGKMQVSRRIGHMTQASARFKSKKWYDRREGKSVKEE